MRKITFLLLLLTISCKENEKYVPAKQVSEKQKEVVVEKIGEKYYEKNCVSCHTEKYTNHNFLVDAIRNDKYEFEFLRNYITHQDSLLKNKNAMALEIKDWYNNQSYVHNFKLNDYEIKSIIIYLKK